MKNPPIVADVVQTFYDGIASQYDKFYPDWDTAVQEEAGFLDGIFIKHGFDRSARVLDCACGIGTQAIGLAALGYPVTASDISSSELAEARKTAAERKVELCLKQADFRDLAAVFPERFDIVIAMDNALPHMLSAADLARATASIADRLRPDGLFIASIRDYDLMLREKPAYSAPYIHRTADGQRVLFQTWDWQGENYKFVQYVIDDGETLEVSRFACEYRATRREEITRLLQAGGCRDVRWKMPEETGFYQPVVIARK